MDIASPAADFLGFIVSLLAVAGAIVASFLFLKEKGSGPWIMLIGSVLSLASVFPQGMEQFVNYHSRNGMEPPEMPRMVYYTFWNWLPAVGALVFTVGLLLTSLQRRGLSRRIDELESILAAHRTADRE